MSNTTRRNFLKGLTVLGFPGGAAALAATAKAPAWVESPVLAQDPPRTIGSQDRSTIYVETDFTENGTRVYVTGNSRPLAMVAGVYLSRSVTDPTGWLGRIQVHLPANVDQLCKNRNYLQLRLATAGTPPSLYTSDEGGTVAMEVIDVRTVYSCGKSMLHTVTATGPIALQLTRADHVRKFARCTHCKRVLVMQPNGCFMGDTYQPVATDSPDVYQFLVKQERKTQFDGYSTDYQVNRIFCSKCGNFDFRVHTFQLHDFDRMELMPGEGALFFAVPRMSSCKLPLFDSWLW